MAYMMQIDETEAERKIAYIRDITENNGLKQGLWLVLELSKKGINVSKTELSDFLSMRATTPKAWRVLVEAEKICKRYERDFLNKRQSGN